MSFRVCTLAPFLLQFTIGCFQWIGLAFSFLRLSLKYETRILL